MTTEYKRPNYEAAYCFASEILIESKEIFKFPFTIKNVVREMTDVNCCSFNKVARKYNIDIKAFGSKSAVWHEFEGMNIIFYNGQENDRRVRFSIAHELAHYYMNHNTNLKKGNDYDCQENEANAFAAQLLMPYPIIHELEKRGIQISDVVLINCFDVSGLAAENRIKSYSSLKHVEWSERQKNLNRQLMNKFKLFTDLTVEGIMEKSKGR